MDIQVDELPGVKTAQFHSFARRMPSYYASIVIMMIAIMAVFHSLAPIWLSCGIPSLTAVLGICRGWWWTHHRDDAVSDQEAGRYLRRAVATLVASGIVVVGMDIRLFSYGDIYARLFLLVQFLSSATCGFYCLMHLRKAALGVFGTVMLPFAALTFSLGHTSTSIAALTSLFTAGIMVAAMVGYEKDFLSLIKAEAETGELCKENLRLAHLDMLTGLPNRRYFFDHIEAHRAEAGESGRFSTVGLIDLDGFKPVNDTYGHRVGDLVLEAIASRLGQLQGRLQHLSRLGGDEFVFLTSHTEAGELQALGQAIVDTVSESIYLEDRVICVGCSVGFATQPKSAETAGFELFERADYALYHAKRTGRARSVLFSEEHETLIREQGKLEQALRNADIESEFDLEYQPIVDLRTGQVTALECLARWNSPILGKVSPGSFISVAEQTGLISTLTQVLLRRALDAAKSWPEHIHLSFNVSPNEMASFEQTQRIIALIQGGGISPHRIAIELTETALMNNFAEVRKHMEMIRDTGALIYLDDFGTGHSSLSYIHALPLDRIKVDRSFVQSLSINPASQGIIRSVISLCRDLQISCIVEGVETSKELEELRELNAELIQGYYFSKPLPASMVSEYISSTYPCRAVREDLLLSHSAPESYVETPRANVIQPHATMECEESSHEHLVSQS